MESPPKPRPKRGRPRKFSQPSQVVALTLPEDVVRGLLRIHADLAFAIVALLSHRQPPSGDDPQPDAELVAIAEHRSLIVVNRAVFTRLPGVTIIPLDGRRAFLALEPGRGMSDLELAVIDRLGVASIKERERAALNGLRRRLRAWGQNRALRFRSEAIIVVESHRGLTVRGSASLPKR